MKYSILPFIIFLVLITGCNNKETVKKPINGSYPHLLEIEKEFVQKMDRFSQNSDISSEEEKVRLKEDLFDLIAKDTTTLSHEFGPLSENDEFNIVTSPDKNLRVYVTICNTEIGRTMNLIQYRDNAGVIHAITAEQWKKKNDNYSDTAQNILFEYWAHKIFVFSCEDDTKMYVISSDENLNGQISNHSITYTLTTYKINNERLEPTEAFVSESKTAQNIKRVFNDWYKWNYPEEQYHDFAEVDSVNQILYVGNEVDNEPIDRYQCFRFNGTNLIEIGESAPFWLHHSLHKYKRIAYLCTTKSHNIRIDDMGSGVYRYASWPRNSMFADAPSLVIYGKETRINNKDGLDIHALSFNNDGYEYRIILYPGRWGFSAVEMEIIKNGRLIQKTDLD